MRLAATPNFRPTFRYFGKAPALTGFLCCLACKYGSTSMLGCCGLVVLCHTRSNSTHHTCLRVGCAKRVCRASTAGMFIIDSNMAGISWILTCVLFVAIHVMTPPQHWGEVTQALLYHQVRKLLLRLDGSRRHVRNWRPQLLLLMSRCDANGGDRSTECLAATLNHVKKSGLLLLAHVVPVLGRESREFRGVGGVGLSRTASLTPFDETPRTRGHASAAPIGGGGAVPSAWTSAARSVQSHTRCGWLLFAKLNLVDCPSTCRDWEGE